jgi:hypothetical protein
MNQSIHSIIYPNSKQNQYININCFQQLLLSVEILVQEKQSSGHIQLQAFLSVESLAFVLLRLQQITQIQIKVPNC